MNIYICYIYIYIYIYIYKYIYTSVLCIALIFFEVCRSFFFCKMPCVKGSKLKPTFLDDFIHTNVVIVRLIALRIHVCIFTYTYIDYFIHTNVVNLHFIVLYIYIYIWFVVMCVPCICAYTTPSKNDQIPDTRINQFETKEIEDMRVAKKN
jgi:hypothetical protein